jgi:hypothetical protein
VYGSARLQQKSEQDKKNPQRWQTILQCQFSSRAEQLGQNSTAS